jgi:signal peptidase
MTGLTYPEQVGRPGRHLDTSTWSGRLVRWINPTAFLETMLVVTLVLILWPATYGGRFGMVMVAGSSMEPTYQLGDAVITWREPVEVGDVILYKVPEGSPGAGNPVIHRVAGREGGRWITKGDNSRSIDPWRPTDSDVLGVAQFRMAFGGRVIALLKSWWVISLLSGLAVGLLLWPEESPRRGRHLSG